MSGLGRYETEVLKEEIERRLQADKLLVKPQPLEHPDWSAVEKLCRDYIEEKANQGWVNDDLKHYIFESAIGAVFGVDVWHWISAR